MAHIYFLRSRPIGIGNQPDGFDPDLSESWLPAQKVETVLGPQRFLGKLVYDRQLTNQEIDSKELYPENKVQWATYRVWHIVKENRDLWVFKSYAKILEEQPDRRDKITSHFNGLIATILAEGGVNLDALEAQLQKEVTDESNAC